MFSFSDNKKKKKLYDDTQNLCKSLPKTFVHDLLLTLFQSVNLFASPGMECWYNYR